MGHVQPTQPSPEPAAPTPARGSWPAFEEADRRFREAQLADALAPRLHDLIEAGLRSTIKLTWKPDGPNANLYAAAVMYVRQHRDLPPDALAKTLLETFYHATSGVGIRCYWDHLPEDWRTVWRDGVSLCLAAAPDPPAAPPDRPTVIESSP